MSQGIVLDGEVTMRSVLQRRGDVEHVLGPELVSDPTNWVTLVNTGSRLQSNTNCYVVGVVEMKTRLLPKFLWKTNLC